MPLNPGGTGPQRQTNPNPAGDWNTVPSYVPHALVTLVRWAAGVVGLPASVVAEQWRVESDFQDNALSPTGARGLTQIEPGTWQSAGCSGNPDNANDSAKCYTAIMYGLVQQYHGDIRKALAAYNAGPGNLQAGYGYADEILSNAGFPQNTGASQGTGKTGEPSSNPSGSPDTSTCALGFIPGVTGVWGGYCPLTKVEVRVLFAVLLAGATAVVGIVALRMAAEREGIIGGGQRQGPAGRAIRDVGKAAAPEAAVASKVAGTVTGRRAAAERREEHELRERGASELSSARRPIRQEIRSGQRAPVRSGRRTGSYTPEGRPAARRESGRQRAARTASTGRKPAARAEAGF